MRTLGAAAFAALAGVLATTPPASADSVAEFYKDRNFTIVIGFSPGGGADTFARFLARHLGGHIPGKPNVIVQNMPGAGGLNALNHLYNAEPQDGTRAILTSPSHTLYQVMGNPNARYDLLKMQVIGTLTQDTTSCIASRRSGIRSIEDTRERELIVGSTGKTASTAQHSRLLANLLGYKLKVVYGYQGTAQVRLAMETGEVGAVCAFWASQALGPQKDDIESGKLVPIVQMGSKPHPVFGDAPLAYDLARNDEQRRIMRVVFGTTELSRPFFAPPGTPSDRVAALRKAFWTTVTSPELKADAERTGLIIEPANWQETEKALREILNAPEAILAKARKAVSE